MIGNNQVLAIIPARKGSKRIINKNLYKIKNKPLISYTIEAAKKSKLIDKIVVSTDSKLILNLSKKNGIVIKNLRPKKLSGDNVPSIDVVKYEVPKYNKKYNIIILLQPTSPLRKSIEIDKAISLLFKKKLQSLVSITKYKFKPKFQILKNKHNKIKELYFNETKKISNYGLNGSIYVVRLSYLNKKNQLFGIGSNCFETHYTTSIDVDEMKDIKEVIKYV